MSASENEAVKTRKPRGRRPRPKPEDGSREAKRFATAVLEVLAGARTPSEAAASLGVSLPRYYGIESVAIAGLVSACEPKNAARGPSPESELATLKKAHEKLERENARYQALARIAQRTVGLPAPPSPEKSGKKRRGRKPKVRALEAIAAIGSSNEERTQAAGHEARRAGGRVPPGEASPEGGA